MRRFAIVLSDVPYDKCKTMKTYIKDWFVDKLRYKNVSVSVLKLKGDGTTKIEVLAE